MSIKKFMTKMVALMMVICILFTLAPIQANAAVSSYQRIFWVQTSDSRITQASLREQIQLFSQELQVHGVTNGCLPIVYGNREDTGANDIIVILDSTLGIAKQGYQVESNVTNNTITISASDADGLFYGCRNVIKQLKLGPVSNKTSEPAVLERGLSLDNGRKYYSVTWIKDMIRELSWAEMNTLVLHFTEEMGIGIESKKYPWLNGRDGELCTQAEVDDDNRVLSQSEVVEIIEYAKKYHVEIIPSLDSPGHMNYMVKKFNEKCKDSSYTFTFGEDENGDPVSYSVDPGYDIGNYFHYNNQTSIVKGSRNENYSRGIDISDEIAVAFTRSLIEEYATLFLEAGCTKFDIGGDELLGWGTAIDRYVSKWQQLDHWQNYAKNRAEADGKSNYNSAVAYDAFMYYMNDLNHMLRDMGYTSIRMWNDDALRTSDTGWKGVVTLDTDIDIWYWTKDNKTFKDYAEAGYQLYNILSDYNYYALTEDYFKTPRAGGFTQAYPDQIYNEWTPYIFNPNPDAEWPYNAGQTNPNVLGSAFAIWSDNPTLKTEAEVMEDVLPMLRAHGAKAWDPNANSKDYNTFTSEWTTFGSCPEPTQQAPAVETLAGAAFRTKNVRSGGTAVLRVVTGNTVNASDISLSKEDNTILPSSSYTVLKISDTTLEAEGKQALYLKFTVTGTGSQTYYVTINDRIYSATVNLWKPAQ